MAVNVAFIGVIGIIIILNEKAQAVARHLHRRTGAFLAAALSI
jgi:hypothetical protein